MATIAKTLIATGASSGLGFEAIKQLLSQSQPWNFILGCRDTSTAQTAYDALGYDKKTHSITLLPLNLSDLKNTKSFAHQALEKVKNVDYLMLNAGMIRDAVAKPGPNGSKWTEAYVVNHLSQHYLIHLLKEKLVESKSRIVVISSGGIRRVEDTSLLEQQLTAGSGTDFFTVYAASKFVQLLGAHYWRRELKGKCDVVAVSPGLIPTTGLARHTDWKPDVSSMSDAKTVEEGAQSMLAAFTRSDFPEDPDQIFLTSWGEWWPSDTYGLSLDKALQDRWSPSQKEIEEEEHVD